MDGRRCRRRTSVATRDDRRQESGVRRAPPADARSARAAFAAGPVRDDLDGLDRDKAVTDYAVELGQHLADPRLAVARIPSVAEPTTFSVPATTSPLSTRRQLSSIRVENVVYAPRKPIITGARIRRQD